VVLLTAPSPARAQFMGHNFKGDFGVNSGTQAPTGVFVGIPFGQWNADTVKNADGEIFVPARFQGFDLRIVPLTVVGVTKKKLLGANYGFMAAVPVSTTWPENVSSQVGSPDWALNDIYVVPIQLGWHTPRANYIAGYGFFAPTGRYEAGGSDNVGLGMWSQEVQAGTTVFLDPAKKISVATTAFLEFHSNKEDQDLKVGTILTLEGGAAYNVPKIGGAFGMAYYLQNKLSDDSGADVPVAALRAVNLYGHNRSFGIGPDLTMGVFQRGTTIGAVNVRYLWESAGKSAFEGSTLFIGLTIGKIVA
jgi:hypothetical protein